VRAQGAQTTTEGLGPHDHGCLVYAEDATLVAAGMSYLREGLEQGQRAMYVGSVSTARMRRHLEPLGDVDDLLRTGRLQLVSLGETYPRNGIDPDEQAGVYNEAIDRALADGFTGLRTFADATLLAATREQAARFLPWEARADRIMSERPWSALCCYDRRLVDPEALRLLASAHPLTCGRDEVSGFHVFSRAVHRMAFAGTVDVFSSEDFARVLELTSPSDRFELDLSDADFIDHHGVLALAQHREASNERMSVVGVPDSASRIAELLGVIL
jgi:hypothetical protein